jgi:Predicted transcriptional regulators
MEEMAHQGADYAQSAALLKALSNPVRLQIVHSLLRTGCHNVSCMERGTGMSQSCISQHLQKLRLAGVVSAERSGNEVYYRVASRRVAEVVAALLKEEADSYVL